MNKTIKQEGMNFNFSKPSVYKIKVQGEIEKDLSGNLGGMQIKVIKEEGKKPITVLIGSVRDQAALSGILNSLYNMHMMVISVKALKEIDGE